MQTVKEESYQAIFRKYYPRMFYYAKRIVGEDAADDVVQEAFLELWNRMDALETDVPQIESYLYKTIYSRGLNYLKRYKKVNTAAIEDINEMRMSCYFSSFGDGEQDIAMKEGLNQFVAMGNALPIVKNAADFVTKNVEEDGVVHALKHFGLLD